MAVIIEYPLFLQVDVFSYGVMMVHVLSGQWPFPGEAVRVNPNNPNDVVGVTEFDRREEYINLIGNEHPLMTLIQGCLSNSPSHRPTSSEVHQRVSAVAADHPPSFTDRVEMMERIKTLGEENETIIMEKEDMRIQVSGLRTEIGRLQLMSSSNHPSGSPTSMASNLREQLPHDITDGPVLFPLGTRLQFTHMADMPRPLDGANLIHIKGNIYVHSKYGDKGDMFQYNICDGRWKTLPRPPKAYFSICSLFGKVLLIGGWIHNIRPLFPGSIHEFDEASQQWVRSTSIPPMPTASSSVTAVSWSLPPALIVCGGQNDQEESMTIVEVYHSSTVQWHTLCPLPFPRSHMMYTVIHNSLYLVGGDESVMHSTRSVMFTSVTEMLDECCQKSVTGRGQWQCLPYTPTYCSGAASLGGCLLAIGGQSLYYAGSVFSSIHAFSPATSSWIHVGDLPRPHTECGAITLPSGELFVIGGEEVTFAKSKQVYKCSIRFD